jgi:GH25 family lysozyme M1 (1,4-beta-N-acetylmuramidase)
MNMSKLYPDISHHHPVTSWDKVETNCGLIITKATQGTNFVDGTLKSIIKECEKRKIPYWLYVYLNKGNELDQAKFLVKTCKDLVGNYFVGYALDVEAGNTAVNCKKAVEYLDTLSCKKMWYSMYSEYGTYKGIITNLGSDWAYWEARYGANNGKYSEKYPCHSTCHLYQYTSKGSVSGITGSIDLNKIMNRNSKNESWFTTPKSKKSASTAKASTVYYSKYTGKTGTIDAVLKAVGVPEAYRGTWKKRKSLAAKNGISNYTGTEAQNLKLIALAKEGKLKKV